MGNHYKYTKVFIYLLIWGAMFLVILFDSSTRDGLSTFLKQHPIVAPFLFVALQLLMASLVLPCSALTVLAGALWGVGYGILFSILAAFFSSIWTFALGRYLFRNFVSQKISHKWYLGVQNLINKYHWKAAMVAYANPVLPGASLGYLFGLSQVTFSSFVVGAILGTLPLQLVLVGIGHLSVKAIVEDLDFWIVAALLVLIAVGGFYKKAASLALK